MINYSYLKKAFIFPFFFWVVLLVLLVPKASHAVKIKDVSKVEGLTEYQITGFGLVVGLRNTGDGSRTLFTNKSVANMLRNMGIEVSADRVRLRNVASVMVVATLPPFLKKGSQVDVTVSSIGDARSLEGGTLLMTTLTGADGQIYAAAQGPISIGGFNVESQTGLAAIRKNHSLVGRVPSGGIVQKEIHSPNMPEKEVSYLLREPDFSTAVQMAASINESFSAVIAKAVNGGVVHTLIPESFAGKSMEFLAQVENIDFTPSQIARVVLNEKTGTIVAGGNISIAPVAISHGNITIQVNSEKNTQQTVAQTPRSVTTATNQTTAETAQVAEEKAEVKVMPQVTNVSELANALNALGVAPRDIISIFQGLKRAGALHAELVTM